MSGSGLAASKPGSKLNSSVLVSPRSGPGQVSSGPAGPVLPPTSRGQPPPLAGGQQRQPPTLAGAGGRSMPGPPLPRPILPRERGYLDKFVEFLVSEAIQYSMNIIMLKSGRRWTSQQIRLNLSSVRVSQWNGAERRIRVYCLQVSICQLSNVFLQYNSFHEDVATAITGTQRGSRGRWLQD